MSGEPEELEEPGELGELGRAIEGVTSMIGRVLGAAVTAVLVAVAVGLVAWFAYASISGAALITFRTGSMSPTMPQGSIAVTVPVDAPQLRLGDVVTVQRAGAAMPVTHRIVEIREVSAQPTGGIDVRATVPGGALPDWADPAAREIVLRGDANQTPDALPYTVSSARRVVAAVPFLGGALMLMQSPIAMGALVIGVGVLVTWAFWPRRREADPEPAAGVVAGADPEPDPPTSTDTAAVPAPAAPPAPASGALPRARHAAEVGA